MRNLAMKRKIENSECIDISNCRRLGSYYVLDEFVDGVDYADASKEAWVWSIGRADQDLTFPGEGNIQHMVPKGTILASLGTGLYQQEGMTCLFLR